MITVTRAIQICAAPARLLAVWAWDPAHTRWRYRGLWVPAQWAFPLVPFDPLPLVAVETSDHRWIVPLTDGLSWRWVNTRLRPRRLPLLVERLSADA